MDNVTNRLLDAAKARLDNVSDYALAKYHLKVAQTTVSNYRGGRSQMSDEIAVKVAALLGERPGAVLAALAMERSKSDDARKVWKDAVKRLGGIAATVLVSTGLIGAPSPAPAQGATPTVCVLCKLRRCRCSRSGSSFGAALGQSLAHALGVKTHRLA